MLKVDVNKQDDIAIITVEGDIDLYSSPQVRKEIIKLTNDETKGIIVNLAGVTYMDSSGVATLVEGLQLVNDYKGKLFMCHVQGVVHDVFELSRLDKVFSIFPKEADAVKAYHEAN
ncbi:STAS domain-containing protein [candidate division KSB1 bacterium]|nr:STAS domain-containing protein [candidate division KSB1 bacterium]